MSNIDTKKLRERAEALVALDLPAGAFGRKLPIEAAEVIVLLDEIERLRGMQVALCRSNECNIRKQCTSASAEHCRSLAAMGLDHEAWDGAMQNLGEQRLRAERAEAQLAAMTKARDEACQIARRTGALSESDEQDLAGVEKVGQ